VEPCKSKLEVAVLAVVQFRFRNLSFNKLAASGFVCTRLLLKVREAIAELTHMHADQVNVELMQGSVEVSASVSPATREQAEKIKTSVDSNVVGVLGHLHECVRNVAGIEAVVADGVDVAAEGGLDLGLELLRTTVRCKLVSCSVEAEGRPTTASTDAPDPMELSLAGCTGGWRPTSAHLQLSEGVPVEADDWRASPDSLAATDHTTGMPTAIGTDLESACDGLDDEQVLDEPVSGPEARAAAEADYAASPELYEFVHQKGVADESTRSCLSGDELRSWNEVADQNFDQPALEDFPTPSVSPVAGDAPLIPADSSRAVVGTEPLSADAQQAEVAPQVAYASPSVEPEVLDSTGFEFADQHQAAARDLMHHCLPRVLLDGASIHTTPMASCAGSALATGRTAPLA